MVARVLHVLDKARSMHSTWTWWKPDCGPKGVLNPVLSGVKWTPSTVRRPGIGAVDANACGAERAWRGL